MSFDKILEAEGFLLDILAITLIKSHKIFMHSFCLKRFQQNKNYLNFFKASKNNNIKVAFP